MRRFINYRTLMTMLTVAAISCFSGDAFGQCNPCSFGSATGTDAVSAGGNVTGVESGAFGALSSVWGEESYAIGPATVGTSTTDANSSYAIGGKAFSYGDFSIAIGHKVEASSTSTYSYVFGSGLLNNNLLNDEPNSIMLGMNSDIPTMFIENSGGTSGSLGRVGIGTTDPDGLLHMLDEDGDDTDLILERGLATDEARLVFQNESGVESSYISYVATNDLVIRNVDEDENLILSINDGGTTRNVITIEADDAQVGVNIGNPNSAIDVEALAIAGGEGIARFTTTDASNNDIISITNASATNGEFAGMISGFSSDINQPTLTLRAYTWDDSGTEPIMEFLVRDINDIDTRPLYAWKELNATHMLMDANGNLGIGTTSPGATLDVNGTFFANLGTAGTGSQLRYDNTTGEISEFTSTINHKSEVTNIEFDKEAFLSLRPVDYRWKENFGGKFDVGLIAEEVEELMPNMVIYSYKHTYVNEETGEMLLDSIGNPVVDTTQTQVWGVDYHKIPIYLLALAKEQDSTINQLTERVNELQMLIEDCCRQEPVFRQSSNYPEERGLNNVGTKLKVYPNPNDGNFAVSYELGKGKVASIVLITATGERMTLAENLQANGTERVNISGPSGVYQLQLEDQNGKPLINTKVVIVQ